MLKAVAGVRDQVLARCGGKEIDLETIVKIFTGVTVVDSVVFVCYDTPRENPIWGEFTRWSYQPGAYRAFETMVEIRYAAHLVEREDWLRFVICKELCHSLESPEGAHDVSARSMGNLIDSFSLMSAGKITELPLVLRNEILAEVAALELLCPLPVWKQILAKNDGKLTAPIINETASKYNLPAEFLAMTFDAAHIEAVEYMLEHDDHDAR